MKRVRFLLGCIILLAVLLRLWNLGAVPWGLEWDEVAIGYDAYSILQTGRDQFGSFLPITFRSLDDYKPPLYIYASVVPVFLFGMTEMSVRLPSAVAGILAVGLTFFLVRELFSRFPSKTRDVWALLSCFFLAISPWHLQFSRAAFETNLSVPVVIASVWLFLRGVRKHKAGVFFLSAGLFGIALFSYHSTRIVTPILVAGLFFLNRSEITRRMLIGFGIVYGIFLILFYPVFRSPDAQVRFRVTNILNIYQNEEKAALQIARDTQMGSGESARIFFNRRISILTFDNLVTVMKNWAVHFSPRYLFVQGDVPLHHAWEHGILYMFDLVLIPVGIYVYLRFARDRRSMILLVWFLSAPIPASVTAQVPHAVRTQIMLPTVHILSALGLWYLIRLLRKESIWLFRISTILSAVLVFFWVGKYLHQYYVYTPYFLADKWFATRREAVEYTESVKDRYERIIVSLGVDMPLNFWLFYSGYPPSRYLADGGTVSGGFADERNHFDVYAFKPFDYSLLSKESIPTLIVGLPKEFPPGVTPMKILNNPDKSPALWFVETGIPRQ